MRVGGNMKLWVAVTVLCLTLVSRAQERVEVPFQLIDGWAIVLDGTLGGLHNQKMLIDTGAVPSAISTRVAKRLRLSGSVQEVSLMNRSIAVKTVRVPEVQLGVVAVEALYMVAMDLGRIEQALGTRIDAVVGLDLLGRQNFSLDYRRKKLVFGTNTNAAAIAFQVKHEAGGIYILIPLDSTGEKLQVLLDTGTRDLMLFQRRLGDSLKQLPILAQDFNLNAGGKDSLAEVEMQLVNVGPISRNKQKAYVWTTPERNLRNFDGLLGPTTLGVTAVAFDFDRHLVSFETR
jgi:predicted aspartyl protease